MIQTRATETPLPRYSVIIPAHNEEARLGKVLENFARVFADSEIIVVLNGCEDRTREVVECARADFPWVHFVDIPDRVGKGGAVRAGFLLARAEAVGYVDADGSTSAVEFRRLFGKLDGADAVIASRWKAESTVSVPQPISRRIASRAFNAIVRLLFGMRFTDTQCGAKVFRRGAIEAVMPHVETANFAFDVDVLFQMMRKGFMLNEEPTTWIDTTGSKVGLASSSLRMLAAVIRLRLRHSLLRLLVPLFDHLFPTSPVVLRDRLRILIVNWRDPLHPQAGGAEAYLFEQAKHWVAWGHEVEWLTASWSGAPQTEVLDGVKIRRTGNALSVYFSVPFVYLREFRDRFDVVVDSENGIPFFLPLFSLKPRVCVMYHVHREVFKKHLPLPLAIVLTWCEEKLVPMVYRNTTFVTISDDTRNEMMRVGISKHRIPIVYSGVDSALVPSAKNPKPTILYLGRLKRYKRVAHLIQAMPLVLAAVPGAELVIAGAGDELETLEALTRDLGLSECVRFEGFVTVERKRELLQQAWVLVNPSEMEGWGINVIEANACGTPAVSYAAPGLREAIVDGYSGLVIEEGADLSTPITRVLMDDLLRTRLETGALERSKLFSWEASARNMLGELLQAIAGTEIRSVDLDEKWTLVGSLPARGAHARLTFANRSRLQAKDSNPAHEGSAL